jgi:hypothetical protein
MVATSKVKKAMVLFGWIKTMIPPSIDKNREEAIFAF